ncbi:MAG: hypothetical protein JW942_04700 [Opitutales bacterium]|nr:hypothetical protein [Opitutales bacterium]
MSMTLATILFGVLLLCKGAGMFMFRSADALAKGKALLRNRKLDTVLHLVASAWFLYVVSQLGQADFGDYKAFLFIGFLAVCVGAWFYVPDFLGVRALSAIYMLAAWWFLGAAFGHYDTPARLFMVTPVYIGLVFALYFAAAPYRVRDLMEWFAERPLAQKIFGTTFCAYGTWLLLVPALFY